MMIQKRMLNMSDFPLDVFPSWFEDMVREVSRNIKTPEVLAANYGLGIVSAFLAMKVYVACDGRVSPTNLWTMTLLPAGTGKSPVLKEMARPLLDTSLKKHRLEDISVAAFYHKMSELKKILMLSSEGTFFDVFLRDSGNALSPLMKSYDEEDISYSRGNNVNISIEKPSLSMGIAIQNDRFAQHMSERKFKTLLTTGLLDRFLPAVPASNVGHRKYSREDARSVTFEVYEPYEHCIKMLDKRYSLDGSVSDENQGTDDTNAPVYLNVSDDACDTLIEWKNRTESEFTEPRYESIRQWLGKRDSFALRLAGNLHVMRMLQDEMDGLPEDWRENPLLDDNMTISKYCMEAAIRLVEYYQGERLKLTSDVKRPEEVAAQKILNYLRRKNIRDIKHGRLRNALKETSGLKSDDEFQAAFSVLLDNGDISKDGSTIRFEK